jgi:malonate-semialdehyde dehydrogenase (acetylating)/methylmalonate-semialdehyde dehydrogenase
MIDVEIRQVGHAGHITLNRPDAFKFYTSSKTVTARWPSGTKESGEFNFRAME